MIREQDSPIQQPYEFSEISLSRNPSAAGPSSYGGDRVEENSPSVYAQNRLRTSEQTLRQISDIFNTFDTDGSGKDPCSLVSSAVVTDLHKNDTVIRGNQPYSLLFLFL